MVEQHWDALRGREARYQNHTWELTGDVEILDSGALIAAEARKTDDVRGDAATLHFRIDDPPHSINPGHVGEHFDRLDRRRRRQYLIVENAHRRYEYELSRLEYD